MFSVTVIKEIWRVQINRTISKSPLSSDKIYILALGLDSVAENKSG